MNNTKSQKNAGFTLMEIIIAVAVVAIMIAAVTPMVQKWIGNAKLRQAEAELEEVAEAMLSLESVSGYPYSRKLMFDMIYSRGYIKKDPISLGIRYVGSGRPNEGELIKEVTGAGIARRKI